MANWRTREVKKLLKEHSKTLDAADEAALRGDWDGRQQAHDRSQQMRDKLSAEYRKGKH